MSGQYAWLVGVGLAVGGSLISNLGLNLQKLTHVKNTMAAERRVNTQRRMSQAQFDLDDEEVVDVEARGGSLSARSINGKADEQAILRDASLQQQQRLKQQQKKKQRQQQQQQNQQNQQQRHTIVAVAGQQRLGVPALAARGRSRSRSGHEDVDDDFDEDSLLATERTLRAPSRFVLQPLWLLGLLLVFMGSIADFAALGFASQIIIAPLGSVTLVSNIFFAPYFSGESLSRRDVIATFTIIAGCAVSVAFANHDEQQITFSHLIGYYSDPRFFFYALMIGTSVFWVWRLITNIEDYISSPKLVDDDPRNTLLRRLAHVSWGRAFLLQLTRFGYAAIAGITGAQSVMFAKGAAILIHEGVEDIFLRYQSYFILGALFATIFLQIKWLNKGLQLFDALYIVPVFQSFWICFSVIAGLLVYRESEQMKWSQLVLFSVGISITVSGVYSLSKRAATTMGTHHPELVERHGDGTAEIDIRLPNLSDLPDNLRDMIRRHLSRTAAARNGSVDGDDDLSDTSRRGSVAVVGGSGISSSSGRQRQAQPRLTQSLLRSPVADSNGDNEDPNDHDDDGDDHDGAVSRRQRSNGGKQYSLIP